MFQYEDHIFDHQSTNADVYSTMVYPVVELGLSGYNGTILVYGQTKSGELLSQHRDYLVGLLIQKIISNKGLVYNGLQHLCVNNSI